MQANKFQAKITQTTSKYLTFIKINTNRSRPSLDLAVATARKIKADILLIIEPNKKAIQDRKDWIYDDSLDTAMKIISSLITVIKSEAGNGFTYIKTKDISLYSVCIYRQI